MMMWYMMGTCVQVLWHLPQVYCEWLLTSKTDWEMAFQLQDCLFAKWLQGFGSVIDLHPEVRSCDTTKTACRVGKPFVRLVYIRTGLCVLLHFHDCSILSLDEALCMSLMFWLGNEVQHTCSACPQSTQNPVWSGIVSQHARMYL